MSKFSASDAALAGFRLVREHPRSVVAWGVLLMVVSIVTNLLFAAAGGADPQVFNWPPNLEQIEQASDQMRASAPMTFFCGLLQLAASAVVFTGVSRVMLRPSDSGFAHLRFGKDEFRQVLALLVCFLVIFAAYMLAVVVAGLFVSGVALVGGAGGPLSILAFVIALIGIFAFVIYTSVRISLVGVLTFVTGKINLKGSLALTRGRFWPLFGAYFVAFIMFIIVNVTVMVLGTALGLMVGGIAGASEALQGEVSSLAKMLTPMGLVNLLVISAMSVLGTLILLAPPLEVYVQLTGEDQNGADVRMTGGEPSEP